MTALTAKAVEVLAAIDDLSTSQQYPPTVREIADRVGLAPSSTKYRVDQLVEAGALTRALGSPRSVVLTADGHAHLTESRTP